MILAIDVTRDLGRIAWFDQQAHVTCLPGTRHSESLAPAIAEWCKEHGRPSDLAVITGPGAFSGVRIGIASALALRLVWNCRLFGASRFHLLRSAIPAKTPCPFQIVIPAVKNRVFLARYADVDSQSEARSCLLDDVDLGLPTFVEERDLIPGAIALAVDPLLQLMRDALCGKLEPSSFPAPLYVRPPDTRYSMPLVKKLLRQ